MDRELYTEAAELHTSSGYRVEIVTCRRCGAAIFLDSRDEISPTALHDAWHSEARRVAMRAREAFGATARAR